MEGHKCCRPPKKKTKKNTVNFSNEGSISAEEMRKIKHSWGTIQRLASDRQGVEELRCCLIRQLA